MPRPVRYTAPTKRRKGHRRSATASGGVTPVKAAVTAVVVGMAEKGGLIDNLPEVPFVGRKGLLAIVAWYWAKHGGGQIARDVCLVTSAICGYQFGKEGMVSG